MTLNSKKDRLHSPTSVEAKGKKSPSADGRKSPRAGDPTAVPTPEAVKKIMLVKGIDIRGGADDEPVAETSAGGPLSHCHDTCRWARPDGHIVVAIICVADYTVIRQNRVM